MTLCKKNSIQITILFTIILAVSLVKIGPRILDTPEPSSDARFHHHAGDGNTEVGVLNAHKNWKTFGYTQSTFLPVLDIIDNQNYKPLAYTHYPAPPYLFSSILMSVFPNNERSAIQFARVTIFLLTALISAISIFLLSTTLNQNIICASLLAAVLATLNGFIIYADNLFLHGFNSSLLALILATAIQQKPNIKYFFLLALISMFSSVELIPCIFASVFLHKLNMGIKFKQLFLSATLAFSIGILLRFTHNALYFQNIHAALTDWFQITKTRMGGDNMEMNFTFWKNYFFEWLRYQRIMISKYGQIWMILVAFFLLYKKQFHKLKFYFAFFLSAMIWNFVFIQHSLIHLFTSRYIIWPFLVSIILVWPNISSILKIPNCSK